MLEFVPVVLKNAFHRPATRNYPQVSRVPFDQQKGHIAIDLPNCIYCGICSRKCPAGAITVNRTEKSWTIDRFKCVVCNACVEGCPKKCLGMDAGYTPPAARKAADVFQMPKAAPAAQAVPVSVKKTDGKEETARA